MSKKYDAAIIHSYYLNPDSSLTLEASERVDFGINLFNNEEANALIMPGGYVTPNVFCPHSEAMKNYSIKKGVDENSIYTENCAMDSVGEVLFTKLGLILPKKLKKIIAVSHDYHIPRLKEIYHFIFGDKYTLNYGGVKSEKIHDSNVLLRERNSLNSFYNSFEGIHPADDFEILKRLFAVHPFYKGRKDLQKELFNEIQNKGNKRLETLLWGIINSK